MQYMIHWRTGAMLLEAKSPEEALTLSKKQLRGVKDIRVYHATEEEIAIIGAGYKMRKDVIQNLDNKLAKAEEDNAALQKKIDHLTQRPNRV